MMSLPRVLDLDAKGMLKMSILPEMQKLRGPRQAPKSGERAMVIRDGCGELQCVARTEREPFALSFHLADGEAVGRDLVQIEWKPDTKSLLVDGKSVDAAGGKAGLVEISAYIDGSVIELLINQSFAKTKRFYYPGNSAPEIRVEFQGGKESLRQFAAWQITPISKDRLTG